MNKNTDNVTAAIKSEERDFAWMALVICTPIVALFMIALGAPMVALVYAAALRCRSSPDG